MKVSWKKYRSTGKKIRNDFRNIHEPSIHFNDYTRKNLSIDVIQTTIQQEYLYLTSVTLVVCIISTEIIQMYYIAYIIYCTNII